jgi:hypothetical protein
MKIEISKSQYKTLVKALFLASWVVNSHKTEEPDDEFERLEQYILSQGKFFDLKNVEFDDKHGKYYHDREFEEKTLKHLDEFVDESFWDELIDRLANRDFSGRTGRRRSGRCPVTSVSRNFTNSRRPARRNSPSAASKIS